MLRKVLLPLFLLIANDASAKAKAQEQSLNPSVEKAKSLTIEVTALFPKNLTLTQKLAANRKKTFQGFLLFEVLHRDITKVECMEMAKGRQLSRSVTMHFSNGSYLTSTFGAQGDKLEGRIWSGTENVTFNPELRFPAEDLELQARVAFISSVKSSYVELCNPSTLEKSQPLFEPG